MTLPGVTPPTLVPEAGVARYISIPSRSRFTIPLFLSIFRHNLYRCSSFCIISLYVSVSGILMPGQPFYSGSELSRSSRSPEVSALDPRPQRTRQSHHLYDSQRILSCRCLLPLPLPQDSLRRCGYSGPQARFMRAVTPIITVVTETWARLARTVYPHNCCYYGEVGAPNPRPRPLSQALNSLRPLALNLSSDSVASSPPSAPALLKNSSAVTRRRRRRRALCAPKEETIATA